MSFFSSWLISSLPGKLLECKPQLHQIFVVIGAYKVLKNLVSSIAQCTLKKDGMIDAGRIMLRPDTPDRTSSLPWSWDFAVIGGLQEVEMGEVQQES
ncbi:hypothetical protein RIF29_00688 [Crotalaria pallida]|uniref:Uncharacterized protein n=1 Tax=Crotalaria pallida TaxID=3830 RepID=A0AAN9IWY2_CROPI